MSGKEVTHNNDAISIAEIQDDDLYENETEEEKELRKKAKKREKILAKMNTHEKEIFIVDEVLKEISREAAFSFKGTIHAAKQKRKKHAPFDAYFNQEAFQSFNTMEHSMEYFNHLK